MDPFLVRTDWFSCTEQPLRAGWYETLDQRRRPALQMLWYNLRQWRESSLGPLTRFGSGDNLARHQWRGLAVRISPRLYGRYVLHPSEACNVRRMLWDYGLMGSKQNVVVATDKNYVPWPDAEVHLHPRPGEERPARPLLPRMVPLPEFRVAVQDILEEFGRGRP